MHPSRHPLSLPMLARFEDAALALMRLVVGAFLVWGVQDNVLDAERMQEFEQFLAKSGFIAPAFMARLSVWTQLLVASRSSPASPRAGPASSAQSTSSSRS